jgi:hypothetical protein
LASSNCVWICGGWDWDLERNWEATEFAEVELEKRRIVRGMVSVVEREVWSAEVRRLQPRISRGSGELLPGLEANPQANPHPPS